MNPAPAVPKREYLRKKLTPKAAEFERQRWEHYQSSRASHLDERARNAWELFHNAVDDTDTQYTKRQIETLDEVGAPRVSMNLMYPILSQQKAMLAVDAPMGRVFPEGGDQDKIPAYVYEKLMNAIWRTSKAKAAYTKALKETLICGISALIVEPESFYAPGAFKLAINHVSWDDLYIDPSARDTGLCFRDAEAVYVGKLIPRRKVKNIYGFDPPETTNQLITDLSNRDEEIDNQYTAIRDVYEKQEGYYLIARGIVEGKEVVVRRVVRTEAELDKYNQGGWGILDAKYDVFVRRRTIIGDDILIWDEMLPITVYPMAIFTADDYDTPYVKAPAEYLREPQKAVNKFYQIVLLNAMLASNTRFMGPAGSFIDKDAWQRYGAAAGHTYEYRVDPTLPDGGRPQIIQPLPLPSAWYTLVYGLKDFMEYNSGTFGPTMGDPASSPETFSTTQSLQNHSSARSRDLRGRIEMSITMLWKAAMEYIQFYGDRTQIFRYLDDMDNIESIPLDQILDDRQIIRYDVQAGVKTSFPTDRQEMVKVLQTVLGQTPDPNFQRLILEKVLQHMDYPISDALLKDMQVNAQLSQQLQEAQDQIKQMDALISQLSKEVLMNKEAVAIAKTEGDLKAIKATTKAKAEVALGQLQDQAAEAQQEPLTEEAV